MVFWMSVLLHRLQSVNPSKGLLWQKVATTLHIWEVPGRASEASKVGSSAWEDSILWSGCLGIELIQHFFAVECSAPVEMKAEYLFQGPQRKAAVVTLPAPQHAGSSVRPGVERYNFHLLTLAWVYQALHNDWILDRSTAYTFVLVNYDYHC